ncbi:hypothetical protein [Amycolatopsis coloradensis]|uniref:hypothetical protein n=1 Tax=Amycolatopsis coloradensis TaxID=76021 RepID=UPI00142D7C6E|nr:hypothetical protein [Amycolatopsis coloradensis]
MAAQLAEQVIEALAIPSRESVNAVAHRPLPVAELVRAAADVSVFYSMARVDAAGTVPARAVRDALSWKPGDRVVYRSESGVLMAYPAADGLHALPRKATIVIPAPLRHLHGIVASQQLLLCALPAHAALVIYPLTALNRMVGLFHAVAESGADSRQRQALAVRGRTGVRSCYGA